MDRNSKITSLQKSIRDLQAIKDTLYQLEEKVVAIEKSVCAIDESMPSDEEFNAMPSGKEKDRIAKVLDLTKEAYDLIDSILGAPEDEQNASCADILNGVDIFNAGDSCRPETISFEAALGKFGSGGKNTVS